MIRLIVNGRMHPWKGDPDTPLLWVLRDTLGLTGTKYGCGVGLCGCCTVLAGEEAIHSCITPVSHLDGVPVTTIEGLARNERHPVLEAWMETQVAECGYCQPGQIVTATALLLRNPNPSESEIVEAMKGNLCRCGTYSRIRRAVRRASRLLRETPQGHRLLIPVSSPIPGNAHGTRRTAKRSGY